jgi:hypothetical protein
MLIQIYGIALVVSQIRPQIFTNGMFINSITASFHPVIIL